MVDQLQNSEIMAKLSTAQRYWGYFSNFMQDMVMFIFATFLMDAILMTVQKNGGFSSKKDLSNIIEQTNSPEAMTDYQPEL